MNREDNDQPPPPAHNFCPEWLEAAYQRAAARMIPMRSHPMMDNTVATSSTSPDVRNVSDDRIQPRRHHADYETTADGDVVIVQPSFEDDATTASPIKQQQQQQDWQVRSPKQDVQKLQDNEARNPSSPPKEQDDETEQQRRHHTRNLSAHFDFATTLSEGPELDEGLTGKKHRRMFSSESMSNPAMAHRRINSMGEQASVMRLQQQQQQQHHHHRESSAGLDVLTAAIDVTKDELAAAAGAAPLQPVQEPQHEQEPAWEPPAIERTSSGPPQQPLLATSPAPALYDHHSRMIPPQHRRPSPLAPPELTHRRLSPPAPPELQHHASPPVAQQHGRPSPPLGPPSHYGSYTPSAYHHPYPPASHYPPGGYFPAAMRGVPPASYHPVAAQYPHLPPEAMYASSPSAANQGMYPPPPRTDSQEESTKPSQGSQTFLTAISTGGAARTLNPSQRTAGTSTESQNPAIPTVVGHHRRMSSFSSLGLGTIFGGPSIASPDEKPQHPLQQSGEVSHHRSTSSSVSFLNALDADDTFLRNLHESSTAGFQAPTPTASEAGAAAAAKPAAVPSAPAKTGTKLAAGGTSKRVRRKCTVSGCPNRVVQGGLCISHGAKRKTCKHPGCTKNVKKAGLCSAHGPARKRCEAVGCQKVAVQGGRCIAHGARKKLCSVKDCTKQAILSGMCKKHHDKAKEASDESVQQQYCRQVKSRPAAAARTHKTGHTRGLSIFHDISADAVGELLNEDLQQQVAGAPPPPPDRQW